MRFKIFALPLVFVSCLAQAQDASLLAGAMRVDQNAGDNSFAVALGYTHHINKYVSVSADYLNEGHPKLHHRDGLGAQLWVHTAVPARGWSVAAGFGPYYYFDTTTGNGSFTDYRNDHGWGQLMSVSAKYHLASNAYLETRLSHTHGITAHDTTMLMFGAGYELRNLPREIRLQNAERGDNLLMLLAGRSIVNSFASETATSYGLEYRRTVNPNVEWSVILMSEGKVDAAERKGISGQVWLLRPFTERTVLEMGFGAYAMRDQLDRKDASGERENKVAPIASIGMRYRISDNLRAQLTWSRVITNYERDSDVFMLGAGVAF
ncbi:hypothetical protein SRABI118_02587 [Massilia sp. Bi118]|uniref:porin family protein n=1 Tax=Massilia sp. Bi118 TaxID=2822346 RepID=UPI001D4C4BE7|nr:porin family protein [Massilia sp. Bi118]CAH0235750.1 hypothetical protein SRABI118_02587 [Massilia sp. Bi118]